MFGKGKVRNIREGRLIKSVSIGNTDTLVTIDNAFYGMVGDKEEVLDEIMIDKMIDEIAKAVASNRTKYNPIPKEIIIRSKEANVNGGIPEEQTAVENRDMQNNIIECYDPRFTLDQVILNPDVKDQINVAISATKHRTFLSENWGLSEHYGSVRAIILNFYGKPGTGKSMAAEAVATALGKKVYHINYSDLESKYVGETPKNIKKAFERATKDDAILIFDEADSFLGKRLTSVTQSADYGVNITRSVLLMELEKFTGVVIFTTNLIKNYDEAFKRRILLSVYFDMPDKDARMEIWKLHLGDKLPIDNNVSIEMLAEKYDGVSGADIKDMVFYAALHALEKESDCVDAEAFESAYKVIIDRYQDKSNEWETRVIKKEQISEEEFLKETKGDNTYA